jgi:HPt (histidine-containing phosphotransfer) domain-containing protein
MPAKVSIVGKKTTFCAPLEKLLEKHSIETAFVQKTQELILRPTTEFLIFLESTQATEWAKPARRLLPSLLLPESFPPPIPLKQLADANMRLMPRETDSRLLVKLLLLDMELHRFSKSISNLPEEDQQPMLSIFEEFRHALGDAHLQIHELFMQLSEHPNSKETLSALRAVAHRLAGSAGSYGFVALSKAAKTLELAIENQKQSDIGNLTNEFLEMLSLLLPPKAPAPTFSKTLLVYDPGQQTRSQYLHWFRSLSVNTVWGMDWVECWKMAQTYSLSGAILNMDKLPVASWPQLFEALNTSPAFASLPKHLVKKNANEPEKACAACLNCLGPSASPATFEALAEVVRFVI